MSVIHVKTTSGFECDVNGDVLDDIEVLDYLAAIEGGEVMKYPKLLSKLFAPEVKKALYDHVRTEDGRVPYAAFDAEITDIFNAIQGGKN